jgi:hypothetical protein
MIGRLITEFELVWSKRLANNKKQQQPKPKRVDDVFNIFKKRSNRAHHIVQKEAKE